MKKLSKKENKVNPEKESPGNLDKGNRQKNGPGQIILKYQEWCAFGCLILSALLVPLNIKGLGEFTIGLFCVLFIFSFTLRRIPDKPRLRNLTRVLAILLLGPSAVTFVLANGEAVMAEANDDFLGGAVENIQNIHAEAVQLVSLVKNLVLDFRNPDNTTIGSRVNWVYIISLAGIFVAVAMFITSFGWKADICAVFIAAGIITLYILRLSLPIQWAAVGIAILLIPVGFLVLELKKIYSPEAKKIYSPEAV